MPSDKRTLAMLLALIVLVTWLVIRGVIPGFTNLHSDFGNYYVSARLVSQGANLDSLYDNDWFHQQMLKQGVNTPGKFSPFPPITAWMLVPLSSLQPLTAQRVFVMLNLFLILACAYFLHRVTGWKYLSTVVLVLASGASVVNNVAFGQMYLLMATCLLISVLLIEQDRLILAAILIGFFAVFKYFPVMLIAGLFFLSVTGDPHDRRRYRLTVTYSVVTMFALIIAQLIFFGTAIMKDYFVMAFLPHLSSELSGQGMHSYLFQSWDSLARNAFVFDTVANPDPWIDWSAGRSSLKVFVSALVLTLAGVVMYFYARARLSLRFNIFLALPCIALLVLLPASATYHFVLLLLPMALLLRDDALSEKSKAAMVIIYIAIGFIPYPTAFRVAEVAGLAFAYPRLWLITLLFGITCGGLIKRSGKELAQ